MLALPETVSYSYLTETNNGASKMKKLTKSEWCQANKHDLRELYSDFLEDTGSTCEDVSYVEFQDYMYEQTKHAA